jgi:hypothetical protein
MRKTISLLVTVVCILGLSVSFSFADDAWFERSWEEMKRIDAERDTDGDGIPDWWEVRHGLNPRNPFDARLDFSGDGLSNLDAFKIDVNPNDPNIDPASGVSLNWMKFHGLEGVDPNTDHDGDGFSIAEEYRAGTDPTDPTDYPGADDVIVSERATPSMAGVRENLDSSVPDNYQVRPNVWRFMDPIGDDKGPGYYTYPTNPVYSAGGFDILSFEVDATARDNITFRITVNADLKQEWGMAADFDIQHFQIYIDQDRVPGSGHIEGMPGLNILFAPEFAWDKCIMITPQPSSRVQIEVDVKAPDFADSVVVPSRITGQGRTITAVVRRRDLGIAADGDISNWAWQVVAQSNEGYPEPEFVLTRNVNEYRGLHRFGGGSDYYGNPHVMDIIAWPARGTLQEAEDQFAILNVWESYPDPSMNIRAVLPMFAVDQYAQWMPEGGYEAYAKELAKLVQPPPQRDRYVSDNFSLYGKLFTRWNWNLDVSKENKIRNSLELAIDGKIFSSIIDFYIRFELSDWEQTEWLNWQNSTPGQVDLAIQSRRVMLVNPFSTVDLITIGNTEVNYSAWTLGQPWYPDRDKTMGLFIDGTIENILNYSATVHYPMQWIGFDWSKGGNNLYDLVYAYRIAANPFRFLRIGHSTSYYTDFEANPQSGEPRGLLLKGHNLATELDGVISLPLGFNVNFLAAYSEVSLDDTFAQLEIGYELDIDRNRVLGGFSDPGFQLTNWNYHNDWAGVVSVRNNNILDTGIGLVLEGFRIGWKYNSFTAARGDTAGIIGGFGGGSTAGTADVLAMHGNQAVHRAPQAADFVESVPLPALPPEYMIYDPVTETKGIGWINDSWEGIVAMGWQGGTAIINGTIRMFRFRLEGSYITFNNPENYLTMVLGDPDQYYLPTTNTINYDDLTRIRGYGAFSFDIPDLLNGMRILLNAKYEKNFNIPEEYPAYTIDKWYLSPKIDVEVKWTRLMQTTIGFQYELASAGDTFWGMDKNEYPVQATTDTRFSRFVIPVTFLYSLPVGFYKLSGGYWRVLGYDAVDSDGNRTELSPGARYGAFFVMEWEYGF